MAFSLLSLPLRGLVLPGLACLILLVVFITTRHIQLVSRRSPHRRPKSPPQNGAASGHDNGGAWPRKPMDYYLFVLGSGGHTKEMLMMMDDGFCDFSNFHRRYLISTGDGVSAHQAEEYESRLQLLCDKEKTSAGSHDKVLVTRARRVHQPLFSTPLSTLRSILDILPALLSPPRNEMGRSLLYPTTIFSNGPGTGFSVALAVHLLKIFYLVPENCMKFVYVESWARITTLSLTGKMLYYSGLADVFLAQHGEVAERYGVMDAGEMVFNARRET